MLTFWVSLNILVTFRATAIRFIKHTGLSLLVSLFSSDMLWASSRFLIRGIWWCFIGIFSSCGWASDSRFSDSSDTASTGASCWLCTSKGYSSCISRCNRGCWRFLEATVAPWIFPSRPVITPWILPTFQTSRGRLSSCTTTTFPSLIGGFAEQSWVNRLWDSLSSVRYSVLHLFQKWFNVFARCLILLSSWLESIVNSSLSELTEYPRLSGRLSTHLPTRRCDGVKSLEVMYDKGLELMIDSVFTIAVCSSSSVSLACLPPSFSGSAWLSSPSFQNTPPLHGDFSRLKFHSTPMLDRCSCTTSSLNTALMNLVTASRYKIQICGASPSLGQRLRHLMNVSVDMSVTISRWTAWVTQHVKRQIHTLLVAVMPKECT